MYQRIISRPAPGAPAGLLSLVTPTFWLSAAWLLVGALPGGGEVQAQIVTEAKPAVATTSTLAGNTVVQTISGQSEKLEITTNSSRILTLGKRIPRVQVNNPELLTVTPLSATQVQVSAKKAGVTVINLWDEEGQIHSVDVFIYGDVRELQHALKTQFPNSSIRVYRYSSALVLTGFIDRPDFVEPIVKLAQDYSPKVINNIDVGGVQQVLLKVKVFEVSRTKLRAFGSDFAWLGGNGGFFASGVSGLLTNTSNGAPGAIQSIVDSGGQTVKFGIVRRNNQVFGLLDALQQHNLAKILAEPNIVAVSGRPATFNEGGEIPILIPQGLGQVSVEYKPFGTQVDFLPIVLGNGNIRLEVRPRISDLDPSNGVALNNVTIPALTVREVDTAVEMKAGQTFALAGLIQRRTEAVNRGLPYLSNVPVLGAPFRRVSEEINEIELLILVTPEFVDAIEPHETPKCYPGSGTMSPDNCELYWGGHLEVPNRCSECGACGCIPTHGHDPCCPDARLGVDHTPAGYQGSGFDGGNGMGCGCGGGAHLGGGQGTPQEVVLPGAAMPGMMGPTPMQSLPPVESYPSMPTPAAQPEAASEGELVVPPAGEAADAAAGATAGPTGPVFGQGQVRPGHYPVAHRPTYRREASAPYRPATPRQTPPGSAKRVNPETGLIGPVGYED